MSKEKIIAILICLSGSLSSFYFPDFFGLRLFEFFGFFLLVFAIKAGKFDFMSKNVLLFFLLIIVYATLSVIIAIYNDVNTLYINQFYGVLFTSAMSFLFFFKFKDKTDLLIIGVKYLIIIHMFFFLYQFINFYFLGNYIDLIEPLTGHSQRNIGGVFSGQSAIRASGLYSEPAAYALNIVAFNFLLLAREKKINFINLLSLVTILLSMSASGILYLIVFGFLYFIFYNSNTYLKVRVFTGIFIFSIVAIKINFIKFEYLIDKIVNFKQSESFKYRIGNTFSDLMSFSEFQILFGKGLGNIDVMYSKGSTYGMMFIEQGLFYGSLFFLLVFLLLKKLKVKYYNIGFVFVLFLGTHTFSQFQFWFLILSLGIISYMDSKDNNYV